MRNDEGDATRNAWSTSDVDDSFHFLMERRFSNSKHLSVQDFLVGHWHQAGRGSLSGLEVQFIQRCCLHCLPLVWI
ncbi:hypothetical protein BaRGS_00012053 [Batillaria attramentaria]|uniref:Uncharacterized protein n=1 Tax=Batillaria attramentaria TaxID=370345 RepID=A0ABD0LAQ3_9CAEN